MNNRVHPLSVSILRQAAEKAYEQGFCSEAQAIASRALQMSEKFSGKDSHLSLDCARDVVLFSQESGDLDNAQTNQLSVLDLSRKLYGDFHPMVALQLRTLADIYRTQGNELEARRCEKEAARILLQSSRFQQEL